MWVHARPRVARDDPAPMRRIHLVRNGRPRRIVGREGPPIEVALRDALDAAHRRRRLVQQVGIDHQVADDRVLRQTGEPGVRHDRPARIVPLGGVDQHVGQAEPFLHVDIATGQVAADGRDLHPGQPREPRCAVEVAVLRRLDRVLADHAGAHHRHPDRRPGRAGELWATPVRARRRLPRDRSMRHRARRRRVDGRRRPPAGRARSRRGPARPAARPAVAWSGSAASRRASPHDGAGAGDPPGRAVSTTSCEKHSSFEPSRTFGTWV